MLSGEFQLLIVTVMDMLEEKGFIPPDFVESETKWFYSSLGIDGMSFGPFPKIYPASHPRLHSD